MDLLPFAELVRCPACTWSGDAPRVQQYQFCMRRCEPDGQGGYEDGTRLGDPPSPHLHVTCGRCGCTQIVATATPLGARHDSIV